MARSELKPRREDLSKHDHVWRVTKFGPSPEQTKRRRAKVIDVLRAAAVLEIEGQNEQITLTFDELELMAPIDQPPNAPARKRWEEAQAKEKQNAALQEMRRESAPQIEVKRTRTHQQPAVTQISPARDMTTAERPPGPPPAIRAVPQAFANIGAQPVAKKIVDPMHAWLEDGLQMNIKSAHGLEDTIAALDARREAIMAEVKDRVDAVDREQTDTRDKLATVRLMIEQIEAQLTSFRRSA